MKYRLRTIFAVIFLAAIVSAVLARMQYLASRAAYHERKGQEYSAKIMELHRDVAGKSFDLKKPMSEDATKAQKRYFNLMQHHARLMLEYRNATYRPWLVVRESAAPNKSP